MNFSETLPLTSRLALILDGLCRVVAARIAPGVAGWPMTVLMIRLVWTRIRKTEGKIQRMLVRFQAGKLRPGAEPGVRGGRPVGGSEGKVVARAASPALGLPRRFAWLIRFVPYQAAGCASQLRHLLGDPEMVALLEAAPQARRVLAPVCRMLGIEAEVLSPVVAGSADAGLAERVAGGDEIRPMRGEFGPDPGVGGASAPGRSWFGDGAPVRPDG